jgi:hypothetical protein
MINKVFNFFVSLSRPQKREHKQKYDGGVVSHYSYISWYKCEKCKKDFRREKGYSVCIGPYHGGFGRWVYLCGTCCPTEERAHLYGINMEYMPDGRTKPPPPPAPPRRR